MSEFKIEHPKAIRIRNPMKTQSRVPRSPVQPKRSPQHITYAQIHAHSRSPSCQPSSQQRSGLGPNPAHRPRPPQRESSSRPLRVGYPIPIRRCFHGGPPEFRYQDSYSISLVIYNARRRRKKKGGGEKHRKDSKNSLSLSRSLSSSK